MVKTAPAQKKAKRDQSCVDVAATQVEQAKKEWEHCRHLFK